MSTSDSVQPWMGTPPQGAGLEGRELLARLRRSMFGVTATTRLGRYDNLTEIGRGGMGVVYRARDRKLRRDVAIKVLRAGDAAAAGRLRTEARAMARLSDPNVVQVLGVGEEAGQTYVVMELVEGTDVARWLDEAPRPAAEILYVFTEAARGLAAAHGAGIVHRDFKPANVLVQGQARVERVRVTDFGLAGRRRGSSATTVAPEGDDETQTGARMGTPRYMAPEQRTSARVDARADQYAWAVSTFEALYGEHPVEGPVPGRGASDTVPRHVRAVLERALAQRPEDRFDSMTALVRALDGRRRRGRARWVLAGGVVVLGTGVVVVGSNPASACDPALVTAQVWSADRANLLQRHLAGIEPGAADAFGSHDRPRVDAWVGVWQSQWEQACRLDDPRAMAAQHRCLRGTLHELDASLAVLVDADRATASRAGRMLGRLSDPAACATAPVVEGEEGPALEELERLLAQSRTRERAGHYRDAASLAERARAVAQSLGSAIWAARADFQLGHSLDSASGGRDGQTALSRAFYVAVAEQDALLAAQAAIALVQSATSRLDRDAVEQWSRHAQTWVARLDEPDALTCELHATRADAANGWAKSEEALAEITAAEGLCDMGPDARYAGRLANARGSAELNRSDYDAAAEAFAVAAEAERTLHGGAHSNLANSLNNLGVARWHQGDLDGAEAAYQEAYEIRRMVLGDDHPKLALALMNLGIVAHGRRDYGRALALQQDAERRTRRALGDDHPQVAKTLQNQAVSLGQLDRRDEALAAEREALRIYRLTLGDDHPDTIAVEVNLAATLANTGEHVEAIERLEAAAASLVRLGRDDDKTYGNVLRNLAVSYRQIERAEESLRYARQAHALLTKRYGRGHPEVGMAAGVLAGAALLSGDDELAWEAANEARESETLSEHAAGVAALHLAEAAHGLGRETEKIGGWLAEAAARFEAAGPSGEASLVRAREFARTHAYPPP